MKKISSILVFLVFCFIAHAELKVSNICSNGMVLQQNSEVALWGTSSPGAQITVTTSWNGASYRTRTASDGRWTVNVKTPSASYKPYTVNVKGDGGSLKIDDVLIGEVWLASGQSNMEMPMRGFYNCPVENAAEYICAPPAMDKVRMFTVPVKQGKTADNFLCYLVFYARFKPVDKIYHKKCRKCEHTCNHLAFSK